MTQRNAGRILALGLTLGLAFDLLFNGKMPGISVLLFAALLLVGVALSARWEAVRPLKANLWLALAVVVFAAMSVIRANGFLILLNVSVCLGLLSLIVVCLMHRPVAGLAVPEVFLAPLQALGMSLYDGIRLAAQARRCDLASVPRPSRRTVLPVVRGLLLALPILALFIALLASADLIFGDYVRRILAPDVLATLWSWGKHGLLITLIGVPAAGGLAYAARARQAKTASEPVWVSPPRFIGGTEALVVTNSVNALFLLFVGIQLPYLFGGLVNITAARYTYAEYARRGFAELVMVAILTLGLIYLLRTVARLESPAAVRVFNFSGTLLVSLTCVMLASAFKRLLLYETAYGFTQTRLYVHVFMVWLALLLAWFAWTLWRRPERFAVGLLIAVLGFVLTLDVLNPDALIVQQNVERYRVLFPGISWGGTTGNSIDVQYLTWLSDDAVPALVSLADASSGETRDILEAHLRQRLVDRQQDRSWQSWQSFHFSRWNAYRLLQSRYGG
jgi:hypothetical protein